MDVLGFDLPTTDPRLWTEVEKILLVGNVYNQLYLNPHLNSDAWENILIGFHNDCRVSGQTGGLQRTSSAIRRTQGTSNFEQMYNDWTEFKVNLYDDHDKTF
eukprot:snap_masked-scaffold_11-processed-gene-4.17-mRNA-1 protein AED:1.00 eAED:1.00 QI:0/0/0/0/1/1/2/0/101